MSNVIQHQYEKTKLYKTTAHYSRINVTGGKPVLSSTIKITNNRGFNNSKHPFLMYERVNPKRWNKTISTGLERTNTLQIYSGDLLDENKKKRHKLEFEFDEDILTISVYKDFYKL